MKYKYYFLSIFSYTNYTIGEELEISNKPHEVIKTKFGNLNHPSTDEINSRHNAPKSSNSPKKTSPKTIL